MVMVSKEQAEAELIQAVGAFVGAASRLDNLWEAYLYREDKPNLDILSGDYPNYLPNFAEFVGDLRQWKRICEGE